MSDIVVKTVNISKYYPAEDVCALRSVSLEIAEGEFVAVTGPSGSGKTTLLNMIGALDRPTEGDIFINGIQLSKKRDLDHIRARYIGFVFQLSNLIPSLTALENVQIAMINGGKSRERARELLKRVSLSDREKHVVTKLSGGERQRVALARALANNPKLILADEPTGNLDSKSGGEVINLLTALQREFNTTLVVVTHNMDIARLAGRVIEMKDGAFKAS